MPQGLHPLRRIRQTIILQFASLLTKPLKNYAFRFPNDLDALKRQIQKGDIILVEGSQRISEVLKYLTQSSWSHSAIYIGDELIRRKHPLAGQAQAVLGEDAKFLLVEALVAEGVVLSPLSKYAECNIRLCRPHNLQREHLQVILDHVINQLGYTYDLQNVLDLARYFLPVSLVPRRFRRSVLHFGNGLPTQVICSSMLASAFGKVGFPILPHVESTSASQEAPPPLLRRLFSKSGGVTSQPIFRRRHPTLITPRDFDLSSYFDTIKFNVIASRRFDYRNIVWAEDLESVSAASAETDAVAEHQGPALPSPEDPQPAS